MAQPPAYSPADFTSKEWNENRLADLDTEHAAIQAVLDVVRTNLGLIQRDDTKLANGSVHLDAISAAVLELMGDWNPRGDWATATAYAVKDLVEESSTVYICVEAHTSGTFATDLSAGKWMQVLTPSDAEIATAYGNAVAKASTSEAEDGTDTTVYRWAPEQVHEAADAATLNANGIELTGATSLNATTHRKGVVDLQDNTLTISAETTTAYDDDQQAVVWSSHASGGTVTAAAGVSLNGVTAGSATVNQGEAFGLYRKAADNWWLFNAEVA